MMAQMTCSDAPPMFLGHGAAARKVVFMKARQAQISAAKLEYARRQALAARLLKAGERVEKGAAFRTMWKAKAVAVTYLPSSALVAGTRKAAFQIMAVPPPPAPPVSLRWLIAVLLLVALAIAVTPPGI